MTEDKAEVARAEGSRGEDVFAVLITVELGSCQRGRSYPARQTQGHDEDAEGRTKSNDRQGHDDNPRHATKQIGETLHQDIGPTTEITGDRAPD